jgi:membrane carboxypeptidase/penicillin-binding protein
VSARFSICGGVAEDFDRKDPEIFVAGAVAGTGVAHRIIRSTLLLLFLVVISLASWFFIYTRDLPDVTQLSRFAPDSSTEVSDACLPNSSTAVPSGQISALFFAALASAEPAHSVERQLARSLMCGRTEKPLAYGLDAMRLSWQIERKFSRRQIQTIYANSAYFSSGVTGVQNASRKFFGKDAGALTTEEAALLAGMLRGPGLYSPYAHPDQALERRNSVLAGMATQGSITALEAARAEASPIRVQ